MGISSSIICKKTHAENESRVHLSSSVYITCVTHAFPGTGNAEPARPLNTQCSKQPEVEEVRGSSCSPTPAYQERRVFCYNTKNNKKNNGYLYPERCEYKKNLARMMLDPLSLYTRAFSLFFRPPRQISYVYPAFTHVEHHTGVAQAGEIWPMRQEWNRYGSFSDYPRALFQRLPVGNLPSRLSRSGFYYDREADQIQCYYCRRVLQPDSPHRPHDSNCNWENCNQTSTEQDPGPIPWTDLNQMIGVTTRFSNWSLRALPNGQVSTNRLSHTYQNRDERLDSLRQHLSQQRHHDLTNIADAGFFGRDRDTLQCFACGVQTSPVQLQGDALAVHAQLNSSCSFIRQAYTSEVDGEQMVSIGSRLADEQHQTKEEPAHDMCVICLDAPASIVLEPCGHLVVCADCTADVDNCPRCNGDVMSARRDHPQ